MSDWRGWKASTTMTTSRGIFFFFFFSFLFFLFFRDGYKVVDVCGMKNRGVSFMKVSEYHSGMQQGGIRVLEGH